MTVNEKKEAIEYSDKIQYGIDKGFIQIVSEPPSVYYVKPNKKYRFSDPEEKVRAEYFVELITKYKYPENRIQFEVTVPRRTPSDSADIVIYEDDELKIPYIVIECKKDGITDAEFRQAIEQAFGNANSLRAKYAVVVAGNTRTAFDVAGFKPNERDKNVISDIPVKYGKTPKYKFFKDHSDNDLKIATREELIRTLGKCHDTVWQGGRLAPTTAFDEVSKLLFCKLKDEKEGTKKGYPYKFQVGTYETAEEIFKRINSIYQKAKKEDEEVFKEDIRLEPKIVYNVVEHLQALALNKIDLDTKGIAFERFMGDFFKGKMGQFFTPRNIVEFTVKMLNPQRDHLVLDPACGSGGFLLNTMDAIRKYAEENYGEREAWDYWHKFAMQNLYGIEINDQIARVCKMNMIIHDDGHTNIISTDSLSSFDEVAEIHKDFKNDRFDIILTNPPFGATVKNTEKDYLPKYTLGENRKNQKTEILFIERCIDFLKPKTGIIGIVLPDSIAINSSLQYVRDFIFQRAQILTIVSLPDFAFVHYGANVKSSLFFLRKLGANETLNEYPVLMSIAEKIGYTATGKEDDNGLPNIEEYFQKFRKDGKRLKIAPAYEDKIFIVLSSEMEGRRIDPKGYTKKFKELKNEIAGSTFSKTELKNLILKSIAGDWGVDPNTEEIPYGYELCYVLRNTNFDNNFNLNLSDVAVRLIDRKKIEALQLKKNEILIEKSGGSPVQPVGRVALIDDLPDDKPVIFSNFLQKMIVNEKKVNPIYVFSYLKTLYHKGYMEYIQNQTTGIKNLLMEEFFEIQVILPNQKIQEQVADKYYSDILSVKKKIDEAYQLLSDSRKEVQQLIMTNKK